MKPGPIAAMFLAALALLAVDGTTSALAGEPVSRQALRHDGLYRSTVTHGREGTYYLRFYSDGSVVHLASPADTIEHLGNWYKRPDEVFSHGRFSIAGGRVSFSVATPAGTVNYLGELRGGVLHLEWRNRKDGRSGSDDYEFFAFPPQWKDCAARAQRCG